MDIVFRMILGLKDSPAPTILLIFGSIALLLAFVRIKEVDVPNKVLVGLIGLSMMGCGTLLYILPTAGISGKPALDNATLTPSDLPSPQSQSTATPQIATESPPSTEAHPSTPGVQVGPYWGYRNEFGGWTLMLNILSQGDTCVDDLEIVVDGQQMVVHAITDPNDTHYRMDSLPFAGSTGVSCNYLIDSGNVIPSQYFSVPATTIGIDLPAQPPYGEWCFQDSDRTWRPCD